MKKIFILLLLCGILGACKKDEPVIKDPLFLLPAATQRGANTAGCLLNGEAIFPEGSGRRFHFFYNDGLHLGLSIRHEKNNVERYVGVASNQRLRVGETYVLSEYGETTNYGETSLNGFSPPSPNYYVTTSLLTGELTITAHNFDKAFLSGTFWFDAVNSEGTIVKIREGRFDMDY